MVGYDNNGNLIPQAGKSDSATDDNSDKGEVKTPEQLAEEQDAADIAAAGEAAGVAAGETLETKGAEPTPAEKRIRQLVAEREELKRREAYWQGVAQGKNKEGETNGKGTVRTTQVAQDSLPILPNPADYEGGIYDVGYINDHDQYLIDTASYRMEKRSREMAENEKAAVIQNKFMAVMRAAAVDDPTISSMMDDPTFFPHNIPSAGPIVALIKESSVAPDVLRHLYNNRDELDTLYHMNPLAAAREIGKLESKMTVGVKDVRKVSQAPAPIKTVGGSGGSPIIEDEDQLSTKEFMERRNVRQFGKPAHR